MQARVSEAGDAAAAMTRCASHPPGVVLLDIGFPGVTGFELLPRLRDLLPAAVIIVVSHGAGPIYAERALAAGADSYIDKDQIFEELVPAIERAWSRRVPLDSNPRSLS